MPECSPAAIDEAALAELAQAEAAHGFTLPAALRSYYGRAGAVAALRAPALPPPRPRRDLGAPIHWRGQSVAQLERGLLVLAAASRPGSHHVAIWLDGSDDPPVLREVNSMPEHAFMVIGGAFTAWVSHRHLLRLAAETPGIGASGTGRAAVEALPALAAELGLLVSDLDGAHERSFVARDSEQGTTLRFREDMGARVAWRVVARDERGLQALLERAAGWGLPAPASLRPSPVERSPR